MTTVERPVWAEVDLDALAHNVRVLRDVAGGARLCAVVKAEGYGHGAVTVARAAVQAGADWLAVALVDEGLTLRLAGIQAPVLVLSEPPAHQFDAVVGANLRPTVYTPHGIEALAAAARSARLRHPVPVHLKVDTGMHRVGAAPADVVGLARAVVDEPSLALEGVWTHCAVADEPGNPFTGTQLDRFAEVVRELRDAGIEPPLLHAANTAATIAHPASRFDLVRCGIGLYGIAPAPALAGAVALRPVLSLRARVSYVKTVAAGEAISYGLRYRFASDTVVATVPIGYADGVRRLLSERGGEVLIGGRRRPIAGTVTMDQITVACGDDPVAPGDEVVLLGRQGDDEITADEWADRLDTVGYEIVCGIGSRVPRRVRGGEH